MDGFGERTGLPKWKLNICKSLTARDEKNLFLSEMIKKLTLANEEKEACKMENYQLKMQVMHLKAGKDDSFSPVTELPMNPQIQDKVYKLQEELTELHRTKSEAAQQLVVATNVCLEKDREMNRIKHVNDDLRSELMIIKEELDSTNIKLKDFQEVNIILKDEYNSLNMLYNTLDSRHKKLEVEHNQLLSRMLEYKTKDAEILNRENEVIQQEQDLKMKAALMDAASEDTRTVNESACSLEAATGTWACPCVSVPTKSFFSSNCTGGELSAMGSNHDGRLLATGGDDRKISIWALARDGFSFNYALMGCNGSINCIDFSDDDHYVAGSSSDNASRIWSVSDQRLRHTFTGHTAKVNTCRFISEGSKLITGSQDRTIKLWDMKSKACFRTVFAGSSCYDIVAPVGSSSIFYSGHFDKTLRVYDIRTESGSEASATIATDDKITSVCRFNLDGNQCLVSCRDNSLKLVDVRSRSVVLTYSASGLHLGSDLARACISPDDMYCAVGSVGGEIFVWRISDGKQEGVLNGEHSSCVISCCWSADGQTFFSAEKSKKVACWGAI